MKLICTLSLSLALLTPTLVHALPKPIGSQASTNGIVAKVNDQIILKSELLAMTDELSADYAKQNINISHAQAQLEAMDILILRKLQLGLIRRAGVTPNDAVINAQILKIAQSQGFDSLPAFQEHLDKKQAGSYAKLRTQIIEDAGMQALWQHQVGGRIHISDQEIDNFLLSEEGKTLNQDEYRTIHIRVPFTDDVSKITDQERKDALAVANRLKNLLPHNQDINIVMTSVRGNYPYELQGADTGYHRMDSLPDELASIISKLSVGEVSSPVVTPSGVDVIMLTDKRAGNKILVPEWQTSHILVKVDSTQSKALAEQKINELYSKLQNGADFGQLAATYSDDTASATQQGQLGWVNQEQMVPEFEAVMKDTKVGNFSVPFTTQFGYHILKVTAKREKDVTNDYLRREAQEILFNKEAPKAQEDWLQELRSSAYIEIIK